MSDARRALERARAASPTAKEVEDALAALDALAPQCDRWVADAMRMFYIEGRTWRDVGAELGYSAVHVRRSVHRALAAARQR